MNSLSQQQHDNSFLEVKTIIENITETIVNQFEEQNKSPRLLLTYSPIKLDVAILPNYYGSFYASEIAALIGKNPNQTKSQALYCLLMKNPYFKKLIDRFNTEYNLNQNVQLVKSSTKRLCTELTRIADKATEMIVQDTDELYSHIKSEIKMAIRNCDELRAENLDDKLIQKIELECQSEIYKKRGNQLEKNALDELEIEKKIRIVKRNEQTYKYVDKRAKLYTILGRIDGFISEDNCIVEIKNRIKKKDSIPVYDSIQCLIYMRLINSKKCYLVECYGDQSKKETLIEWDQCLFNEIHEQLTDLVHSIRKLTPRDVKELVVKYNQEYLE